LHTDVGRDDIDHRLNSSIDVTAEAVKRIEKLFSKSVWSGDADTAARGAASRYSGRFGCVTTDIGPERSK
jgi:hypothetical protein